MDKTEKKVGQLFAALVVACIIAVGIPGLASRVSAAEEIAVDAANFPDTAFRNYVTQSYDSDKNGTLSVEELTAATNLRLEGTAVADLTGVEYLTFLTQINLTDTSITALDVSKNINLEYLYCEKNLQLKNINVSNNTKLKELYCSVDANKIAGWKESDEWIYGKLTALDVRNCPELEVLNCFSNNLTELDVTNNPKLRELVCDANPGIKVIDTRKNPELMRLSLINTGITKIDVSKNLNLERLECNGFCGLSTLNVSRNTALKKLFCPGLNQAELDLSQNPNLIELKCSSGKIATVKLNPNTYGKLELKKADLNGENAVLSELTNIIENAGILTVTDITIPATYQYTYAGWLEGEWVEGNFGFTILYTDEPSSPLDNAVRSQATHLFYDYTYTTPVSGTAVVIYGNGAAIKSGETKIDNRSVVLYTDILPSYSYTEAKGKVKAGMGKVIVGITMSDTKPTLDKGKIVDSQAAQIAKAKIKNGQITVTATGKAGGVVYLWVMDTGGKAVCEGSPINVKLAPKKMEVQDATGNKLNKFTITEGESADVSVAALVGDIKSEDCTYTAAVDENSKSYLSVEPTLEANCFTITATGLKGNKDTKASVTFTCDQNGKKVKFSLTIKKK